MGSYELSASPDLRSTTFSPTDNLREIQELPQNEDNIYVKDQKQIKSMNGENPSRVLLEGFIRKYYNL